MNSLISPGKGLQAAVHYPARSGTHIMASTEDGQKHRRGGRMTSTADRYRAVPACRSIKPDKR